MTVTEREAFGSIFHFESVTAALASGALTPTPNFTAGTFVRRILFVFHLDESNSSGGGFHLHFVHFFHRFVFHIAPPVGQNRSNHTLVRTPISLGGGGLRKKSKKSGDFFEGAGYRPRRRFTMFSTLFRIRAWAGANSRYFSKSAIAPSVSPDLCLIFARKK